ncbi:NAD(P)-dependent oxidoreductase [Kitasatospora sp. NPDC054939]
MRITVIGAAGNVGRRVVTEALNRGHEVTAVIRDPARAHGLPPEAVLATGSAADPQDVARLAAGQDVVITATRPPVGSEGELAVATKGLLAGLAGTGVRLLAVGGAGSLLLPGRTDGLTVVDGPDFPPSWRPIALACNEQLDLYRAESELDWAYLSPAALLEPGERTGRYRLGRDELVVDAEGRSEISMEDLAVALLDEAERPAHRRTRFTVGY